MSSYVLGIDAGATKVVARLASIDGEQQWQEQAGSASLTNQRAEAIQRICDITQSLLEKSGVSAEQVIWVCGIAGACNDQAKAELEQAVIKLGLASVEVTTDAITSLYGAGNGEPMIVVAVGTGSVAMRLDHEGVAKQFGGWGFVAGDQGGGADIGRNLLKACLTIFDAGSFEDDELVMAVFSEVGNNKADILNWISAASPADFGRLARIIIEHPENPLSLKLLAQAGNDITALIRGCQTHLALNVCLVGGLADYIAPLLHAELQPQLTVPKGDSLDGAIWLAKQKIE